MILPCPECGKEISTEAKICPNCGIPMPFRVKESIAPHDGYPFHDCTNKRWGPWWQNSANFKYKGQAKVLEFTNVELTKKRIGYPGGEGIYKPPRHIADVKLLCLDCGAQTLHRPLGWSTKVSHDRTARHLPSL